MRRSLRVAPEQIAKVRQALRRKEFPSQQALATEMGMARTTIHNFLTGKPVERLNFAEICEKLRLDWQDIADIEDGDTPRETEQPSYPLASRSEPEAVSTSTGSDGTMAPTEEEFIEAARNWDLERLYVDLEAAKREWGVNKRWGLTTVEKQYLRGLLCGDSPDEIAAKLDKDVKLVRVQLSNNLYRYVEKLLDRPPNSLENWRDIVIWLAEAGYRLNDRFEQKEQNASVDIDALVQEVREKVRPLIQEWCGAMKVLNMSHPIGLTDIYTNVNILEKLTARRRIGIDELRQNFDLDEFDRFGLGKVSEARVDALEAVNTYPKLMVWGKPGAGKTTFLKYLAIQCIGGNFQANRVPIFIEIDHFAQISNQPDLQTFINQILANCEVTDMQAFELLKQGRFFILLDGLDEVREEDSHRILKQIQYFLNNFHKNHFVMTCRIAGQQYSPENFIEVEIADFDEQQIIQFANKWFQARYHDRKADNFIKNLKRHKSIAELATNPLLLTMLCLVFEDTHELPSNRFELYREAVDILLIKWDASREKERRKIYEQLSVSGRRDLLSYIAYNTFNKSEYFFTLDDLRKYITDYISALPYTHQTEREVLLINSEEIVVSIESQHGLLVEKGKQIYAFSHLTFHEYFTARKITFPSSPEEFYVYLQSLASHIPERRWKEIFLLVSQTLKPADYLINLMKERIDNLIANDENIQIFMEWINQKSLLFDTHYKRAAIRAFYVDVDLNIDVDRKLGCLIDFSCTCNFARAEVLTRALKRNLTDTVNKAQELTADIDIAFVESDIAIALERVVAMNILEREFASELEPEMRQKLQQLKEQLPDRNADKEKFKQWWKVNGRNWAKRFKVLVVSYHEIGGNHWHNFSEYERQLLKQYYEANLLLVECMNSASISAKLRSEIEETLLLPIAEIERRKK